MEFTLLTFLELTATICGLIHVFLLTREKVIAWPFGILTVAIYVYIFYVSKLYSDTILHVFYIFINTYGWYNWSRRKKETAAVEVSQLSYSGVSTLVGIIIIGTLVWGYFMNANTDADFAYFDAFTTVASLSAQYLLTQKKIDNWLVWMTVNIVAMPIYFMKGLYLTSGLYFVYLLLVIFGYIEWRKAMRSDGIEHSRS